MGAIEDHIRSIFKIPKDLKLSRETVFVFNSQSDRLSDDQDGKQEFTARELIELVDSFEFANIFSDTGTTGKVEIENLTPQAFIYFFKDPLSNSYDYKPRTVSSPLSYLPAKPHASDEQLFESLKYLELCEKPLDKLDSLNCQQTNEIKLNEKARILHHLVEVSKIFEEISIQDKDKTMKRNNELIHFLLTLPASPPKTVKEGGRLELVKSLSLSLKDELLRRAIDMNPEESVETIRKVLGPFVESTASLIERVFTSFTLVEDTIRLPIVGFKAFCANGESRASETVYIAGLPWNMQCTAVPLTDQTGVSHAFHLYLHRLESDLPVACKTKLQFRLRNQTAGADFVRSTSANFASKDGFGFAYFVYASEFEEPELGFLLDDTLLFEVSVKIVAITRKNANGSKQNESLG